jgi:hypothetical protein
MRGHYTYSTTLWYSYERDRPNYIGLPSRSSIDGYRLYVGFASFLDERDLLFCDGRSDWMRILEAVNLVSNGTPFEKANLLNYLEDFIQLLT